MIQEYISNYIRQKKSQIKNEYLFKNARWVMINDLGTVKRTLIFRRPDILLVSENGKVEKSSWDLIDEATLLITYNQESLLLKFSFIDDQFAAFRIDGSKEMSVWINEYIVGKDIDTVNDLQSYLISKHKQETNQNIDIEKKQLRQKLIKLKKKWFLTSEDILEVHDIIDKYLLFDNSVHENINYFKDIYGFDLIAEIKLVSNTYDAIEQLLLPLINKNILEKNYPHEIKSIS